MDVNLDEHDRHGFQARRRSTELARGERRRWWRGTGGASLENLLAGLYTAAASAALLSLAIAALLQRIGGCSR
jgi:hypothetical protein